MQYPVAATCTVGFLGGASGLSSVAARAGEDMRPRGPAPEVTPWPSTATTNRYWGHRVQGWREKVGGFRTWVQGLRPCIVAVVAPWSVLYWGPELNRDSSLTPHHTPNLAT